MRGTKREKRPGVWELRVYVGNDRNGRPVQRSVTFHGSAGDADTELCRLVAKLGDDERGELGPSTKVNQALDMWEQQKWDDLSPSTTRRYKSLIKVHIRPGVGSLVIRNATPLQFEKFFRKMKQEGASEASVRQARAILHRALKLARKWSGNRLPNPVHDAELPKWTEAEQTAEVRSPEDEEVRFAIAEAYDYELRFGAYCRTKAATGARRGEVCALRWTKINWDASEIKLDEAIVAAEGGAIVRQPKTRASKRPVAIDAETLSALRDLRAEVEDIARKCEVSLVPDAFVFSTDPTGATPPHPDSMSHAFAVIRMRGELAPDLHLNSMRHWQSTTLDPIVSQKQKMARMGHTTVPVSHRYTHKLTEEDRKAAEHVASKLNGKPKLTVVEDEVEGASKQKDRGSANAKS